MEVSIDVQIDAEVPQNLMITLTAGPFKMDYNIRPIRDLDSLSSLYQFIEQIDEGVDRTVYTINDETTSSQSLYFHRNSGLRLEAISDDPLQTYYSIIMREEPVYREFLRQLVNIYEQIIQ
jgi:hypothetical protein